jgi:LysM repeat protein
MKLGKKAAMVLFVMIAMLATAAPVLAADSGDYIVQRGDTLVAIARRHGVSLSQLASDNGLRTNSWVYVGQRLVIPGDAASGATSGSSAYTVRRGDTLTKIARRYGVSLSALARANGIRTTSWVYVGQRLVIPGGSEAPGPSGNASGTTTYIVRRGDTLTNIARRHGVSVSQLARANGIRTTSWVYVGQRLVIRGTSGSPRGETPNEDRWIDVSLAAQTVTAYEGSTPVFSAVVSTGLPRTPTPVGQYRIWIKLRYDDMSGPGYYLRDVPYVMYFHRGYGLHGTYWHTNFGTPMSHGCVNLRTEDAGWLFNWASVGTLVVVH